MQRNLGPRPVGSRSAPPAFGLPTGKLGLIATAMLLTFVQSASAERPRVYAVTGATIVTAPGNVIEAGTLVLRDGLIEAVGIDVQVPPDAEVIDGEGLTVYAGWIDPYSHLAMQPAEGGGSSGFNFAAIFQQSDPPPGTGHPIELVHPQYHVTTELIAGDGEIEKRRELGFTAALAVPRDGVFRGWSALVALRDGHPRDLVIAANAAQHAGFDRGQFFGGYPSDLLGTMATFRQVHYDTFWYIEWKRRYAADPTGMQRPPHNDALEALELAIERAVPFVIEADSTRMVERTIELASEFGASPIVKGSGYEYEMIGRVRDSGMRFIVPVDFPDEPDVSNPERLPGVSLQSLQRWEKAASNAGALEAAGVTFALTPYGMGNASKFTENVRKAIDAGLSEVGALAAVTTVPAEMLGVADTLGTVEAGKIANVVIATAAPFAEGSEVRHVFVDGHHFALEEKEQVGDPTAVVDPRGEWAVTMTVMGNARNATWTIEGSEGNYTGRSVSDRGETEFESIDLEGNAMTVVIAGPMGSMEVTVVVQDDAFTGTASIDAPGGQTFTLSFKGERISGPEGGAR